MDYKVSKGHYYYCIKTVIMDPTGVEAYTKGKVYYSTYDDNLTDNQGDEDHSIFANFAAKYFIPVDAVVKAYAEAVRANSRRKTVRQLINTSI